MGAMFLHCSGLNTAHRFLAGWELQLRDKEPSGAPEETESRWQGHKKMGPSVFLKQNLPPAHASINIFFGGSVYMIYSNISPVNC